MGSACQGAEEMILRLELAVSLLAHMQDMVQPMTHSHLEIAVPWSSTFLQEAVRCQDSPPH